MRNYLQTVIEQERKQQQFNELLPQAEKALEIMIKEEKLVKCGVKLYRDDEVRKIKNRIERLLAIITVITLFSIAEIIISLLFTKLLTNSIHQIAYFCADLGIFVFVVCGATIMIVGAAKDDIISFGKKPVMTVGEALQKIIEDAESDSLNTSGNGPKCY